MNKKAVIEAIVVTVVFAIIACLVFFIVGNIAKKTLNNNFNNDVVYDSIKQTTKIILEKSTDKPGNSQMLSHFGGDPYFLKGEEWTKNEDGKYLDFVFQIFNSGSNNLPDNIQLVQFYYDFEEYPWSSEQNGWLVKTYGELDSENIVRIEKPSGLRESEYCKIKFENIETLPDQESLGFYVEGNQSQLGGYPRWIQYDETPKNKEGEKMDLLFQIDSEENADLMWGDAGMIYVFYNENDPGNFEFIMQCY